MRNVALTAAQPFFGNASHLCFTKSLMNAEMQRRRGINASELDRCWAGQIDQKLDDLSEQFERERKQRIDQFAEDRKERRQYNEGVRNVIEA
jgi:hypothetical protein